MSKMHVVPDRFNDLSGALESQKFRSALILMRTVAAAARERHSGWHSQREAGVSSVVRFIENADELLSVMKKRVDEEIALGSQYGRKIDTEAFKGRLAGALENIISMGVYRMQYELACMSLPPVMEGEANGAAVYRISEMFRASNETSLELGIFLDSIAVPRADFRDAVDTLREFLMSKREKNTEIKEDKGKILAVFAMFMDSYADFRICGTPMEEGAMK
ncbi:MAG: hypothetical protein L0Y56_13190 [Nitrospira sp.]|nr:hypothetical protein [Nitrospira sp.]